MKNILGIFSGIPAKKRFILALILDVVYLVITFFTITIATFGVGAGLVIWTMTSFFEMVADEPSHKLYTVLNRLGLVFAVLGILLWLVRG